ncbi:40S ribosomal protein SA-like [Impatiens glandulifera]|uniref:40S ribosomal protein SA-like n=1 Tax=Impatiens glandulifera TaxID=253017 RepID=UPI001FB0FDF5|nr:40S ribosomal protein SA-like [Impatiens glandulifera]
MVASDDCRVFVARGIHLECGVFDSSWMYDVRKDEWSELPHSNMLTASVEINLRKTWEKFHMIVMVIVAIKNPQDIIVHSDWPYGQIAVLRFAQYIDAHATVRFRTPRTFTNKIHTSFSELRFLILIDLKTNHQHTNS